MSREILPLLYDVSLRVRLLKTWENAHAPYAPQYTERELLSLEMMAQYSPVTESMLAEAFGLATSSASDLVRKLIAKGAIEKASAGEDDARQRPLTLSVLGKEILGKIKASSAERYDYLLKDLDANERKAMLTVLDKMKKAVTTEIDRRFNRSI